VRIRKASPLLPPILHCSHHFFPDCPPRERAPAFSCLLNPPGIKHPVSPTSSGQRIPRDCANVESCARRLRDVDNRVFAPHAAVHPARFNEQPADLMNPSCPSIYLPCSVSRRFATPQIISPPHASLESQQLRRPRSKARCAGQSARLHR
jgi:hypothetical protein